MRKPSKKPGRKVNATGRNTTGPPFVRLQKWILKSDAWKATSPGARVLFLEVYRRFNGSNNGEIVCGVRDGAEAAGLGERSTHRHFQELEARGFLKPRSKGSFDCKLKLATEWEITSEECFGRLATKEFMGAAKNKTR